MPIPLIIGAAIAVGTYGAKKCYDAKKDYNEAEAITDKSNNLYQQAKEELELEVLATKAELEKLGEIKYRIYKDSILDFFNTFDTINDIENLAGNNLQLPTQAEYQLMQTQEEHLEQFFNKHNSKDKLSFNELTELALFDISFKDPSSFLASTSELVKKIPISDIAKIAPLLSRTSLIGGGISAGVISTVGSAVVAPVFAIGASLLASKAKEIKKAANAKLEKTELAVNEINELIINAKTTKNKLVLLYTNLVEHEEKFIYLLIKFKSLVFSNSNYTSYSKAEQDLVSNTFSSFKDLNHLISIQILQENGELTEEFKNLN